MTTIHIFNYSKQAKSMFHVKADEVKKTNINMALFQNYIQIINQVVMLFIQFIPLFVGAFYVRSNNLSVGELVAFNTVSVQLLSPLANLVNLISSVQVTKVYEKRIADNLRKKLIKAENQKKQKVLLPENTFLVIENFCICVNNQPMLKVDKLYIKKGEIILLKGKNGTGKSLFLKSIAQIYGGFSGEIYLNNKSISYMEYIEFTRSLIYVSKNEGFVLESLKEELNLNLNDNIANQVIEILNLDRIIQKLKNGLEESCLDLELYLSTGEIQRLRIARALMREPKVLILDEVLTNIDEESSQKIIYQISDVFDMTIICVEHHIKESTFDKVFIINEKKLIEKSYKRIGGENNEKSN